MRVVFLMLAALLGLEHAYAQEPADSAPQTAPVESHGLDAEELQVRIKSAHATAMKTTVALYGRNRSGRPRGSGASGVIVSAEGYVLTAAHVIDAIGDKPIVLMPDGRLLDAVSLGHDDGADYGLVQIEGEEALVYAEIGSSTDLVRDEVCLMYGHPGGVAKGRPAVLRLGVFLGIRRDGMVRTSCKMMPGDSGGPVFDLDGQVVGINSQIRLGLDHNYHAAVDAVLTNWQRLVDGEQWQSRRRNRRPAEPSEASEDAEEPNQAHVLHGGVDSLHDAFADAASLLGPSVARAEDAAGAALGLCVAVSENRLLAKSSRLDADEVQLVFAGGGEDGADLRAVGRVIARDVSTDLALIEAQELSFEPAQFIDAEVPSGTLLGTVGVGASVMHAGVAGAPAREVPNSDYGILGVRFDRDEDDGKIEIETAFEQAPAHAAGLRSGDTLLEFNGEPYTSGDKLRSVLRRTHPGENVTMKVVGDDGEEEVLEFALGSSGQTMSGSRGTHAAYQTEVSLRRDGFPAAQRHDMPLEVGSCTTLVIDLAGRVVGLNAARFDRTASLLLPTATVLAALERLDDAAKSAQ